MMQTSRILLRPWRESDAETLYQYASDPEVGPRAGWPPHQSVEESLEIIRTLFHSETMWAVEWKETGEAIGCVGYLPAAASNLEITDDQCEVGYWIARPYWGKGICTEAMRLVVEHCFRVKGFTLLWCTYFPDNPASGRVMEKCGFRDTGRETVCPKLEVGADRPVRVMRLERGDVQYNPHWSVLKENLKHINMDFQGIQSLFQMMSRHLLVLIFTVLSASQTMGQENVFHADNLAASDEPGLILGIPAWAVQGDTNLSWIKNEQLSSNKMKTEAIHRLCQTEPLFAALDTIYEIPVKTMEQMVCMPDINHDGKADLLLYAMLPNCDSRPFIFMAVNRDNTFQEIFAREGDIVGWMESENSTQIQILVSGCCEDRHGYLYEYSSLQEDTLIQSVFWQGNATHPNAIHAGKTVTIRNTAILLPAPGNPDHQNDIARQVNWKFFKGDTGEVLYETKADNRKWYYVRMHVKPRNAPKSFVHATYVYGWISEDEMF